MKKYLAGLLSALLLASTVTSVWSETVVKILHIEANKDFYALWRVIADNFEKANAGIKVEFRFMENEALKARLPTMLQSDERPHIFFSWGGGVFHDQVRAGMVRDITRFMEGEWAESLSPVGLEAFTYENRVYGAPMKINLKILWYNKALLEKAGVKPVDLTTWSGFTDAVRKCKAADITPLAAGGGDKWPLHLYWTMLALRIGGQEAFAGAYNRTGEGFDSAVFVKAGELWKELIDLEPFQKGYLGASYADASGYFGDAKACMHFTGDFDYSVQKTFSKNGEGIPDAQLGYVPFPMVAGGKGDLRDTLGAVNGWLLAKGAPDKAVHFLRYFLNQENQTRMAAAGMHIPMTKGTAETITNPYFRRVMEDVNASPYLQIVYDQMLGANVGRVVNDVSADIAALAITPQEAAEQVQQEWEMEE